jgi:hypothetical protein
LQKNFFINLPAINKIKFNIAMPNQNVNLAVFKAKDYRKRKINAGKFFEIIKPNLKFKNLYYNFINFVFPDLFLEFDELLRLKFYKFMYLYLKKTTNTKKIISSAMLIYKLFSFKQAQLNNSNKLEKIVFNKNKIPKYLFSCIDINDFDFDLLFYYVLSTSFLKKVFRKKNFFIRVGGSYGLRY